MSLPRHGQAEIKAKPKHQTRDPRMPVQRRTRPAVDGIPLSRVVTPPGSNNFESAGMGEVCLYRIPSDFRSFSVNHIFALAPCLPRATVAGFLHCTILDCMLSAEHISTLRHPARFR